LKTLALDDGSEALLVTSEGDHVVLLAKAAAPPGSPLRARFEGAPVVVKVRGSRRVEPDGEGRAFRVEGRFVGLTRELRARLQAP
jgi:hypothetical protein